MVKESDLARINFFFSEFPKVKKLIKIYNLNYNLSVSKSNHLSESINFYSNKLMKKKGFLIVFSLLTLSQIRKISP